MLVLVDDLASLLKSTLLQQLERAIAVVRATATCSTVVHFAQVLADGGVGHTYILHDRSDQLLVHESTKLVLLQTVDVDVVHQVYLVAKDLFGERLLEVLDRDVDGLDVILQDLVLEVLEYRLINSFLLQVIFKALPLLAADEETLDVRINFRSIGMVSSVSELGCLLKSNLYGANC